MAGQFKDFISYAEAYALARQQGILTQREWRLYRLQHPEKRMPYDPCGQYGREWPGWEQFTGRPPREKKPVPPKRSVGRPRNNPHPATD